MNAVSANFTIHTVSLALPYRLGQVNCYLLETPTGFILVDTGSSNARAQLLAELDRLGCSADKLALVLLTHGDFDHTGNAAFLQKAWGVRIAMHPADAGMAERGDMFWNRKKGNALIRRLAPFLFGFGAKHRFTPDLVLEDGFDLAPFGLPARILTLPGHSRGSVGVLVGDNLFCGDLLENTGTPALNSIMDNPDSARESLAKLNALPIQTVYPGHGPAWQWAPLATHP